MGNIEKKNSHPLRINRLSNKEQSGCPVTVNNFIKQFFK